MKIYYLIFLLFALFCFLFISLPLLGMFLDTSPKDLLTLLFDKEVLGSIILTFECAFYATLLALLIGTPLAYLLARYNFLGKNFLESIIDIPIMVPHTAVGIALLVTFTTGSGGDFFKFLGINFMGTKAGITLGMLFVSIPFYIDSVKDGFAAVDEKIENVARSLGANKRQVFTKIMIPIAFQSIYTGSTLMWGRGISEFGAVVILAYHPMVAPVLIYERFTSYGLNYSRPVAVLLIFLSILIFFSFKILSNSRTINRVKSPRNN